MFLRGEVSQVVNLFSNKMDVKASNFVRNIKGKLFFLKEQASEILSDKTQNLNFQRKFQNFFRTVLSVK